MTFARSPCIDFLSAFSQLGAGDVRELVNGHDQKPLHFKLMLDLPGKSPWNELEQGPATWRVAITRRASGHGNGGGCGGV